MKKFIVFLTVLAAIPAGWYGWDVLQDRSTTVKVLRPTSIYMEWELVDGNQFVGSLQPGEKLNVLRIRHGKGHMAVQVEKADGVTGWLFPDSAVEIAQQTEE